MPHRFHVPDLTADARDARLSPDESAHLTRVLRLRVGAAVQVFDGRGLLRDATVADATPRGARLILGDPLAAAPEPPAPIVVVQALLKGDAMDAAVRDATVLGASAIWPVVTQRTNVPSRAADAARDRWRRVSIAAAKQCGRAVLPDLAAPRPLAEILGAPNETCPVRLMLVEPSIGESDGGRRRESDRRPEGRRLQEEEGRRRRDDEGAVVPVPPTAVCLAIGPEGGWAPEEVAAAESAGWLRWSLAPVTLRGEQVALAALSVLRYAWDVEVRRRIT